MLSKPKARKIETETCLQRAERLEALSKTKQDLRLTQRQLLSDLEHDQGGFVKEIPRDRIYYLVDVCRIII